MGALSFALIGSIVTDILKYSTGGQPDGLWLIFAFIITSIALLVYITYVIKLFRARSAALKKQRAQDSAPLYPDPRKNPHWKRIQRLNEIRKTIRQAKVRAPGWEPEKFWEKLGGALFLELDEKKKIADELKKMPAEELAELIRNLDRQAVRFSRKLGEDLFSSLTEAVRGGRLANYADIEGADAEASRTGNQSLRVIARLAVQDSRNQAGLLKEVEKILPHVRSPHVWLLWANRIKKLPGSQKKLEWAYPQMKTLGGHDAYSWNDYANLLVERLNGMDEAEAAYYLAIELNPK
ncbi:MAG: hypothetical protein J2P31_04795, partial [Blastocatellia bacterium]|nr:hypothetical protein [Blastocatellia bacterium]